MTVYTFDGTMDGLLTAVFDAFALKEQPEKRLSGEAMRLISVSWLNDMPRRYWKYMTEKQG